MLLSCVIKNTPIQLNNIQEVRIKESIYSPIIEGEIDIIDVNITKFLDALDDTDYGIVLIVYDVVEDTKRTLAFTVDGFQGGSKNGVDPTTIKFSSWYMTDLYFSGYTTTFSNTTYTNMLRKLLEKIKINTDNLVKSTYKNTITFPHQSIYDSIMYLKDRCADENNKAGYLIFPNLFSQQMNIVNFNYLYSGELGIYESILITQATGSEYIGLIEDLKIVETFDIYNDLSNHFNTSLQTFNLDKGKLEYTESNLKDVLNEDKNMYNKTLLNDKYFEDLYIEDLYIPFSNIDEMRFMINNKYYNSLANIFNLNTLLPGDYNRKLGNMLTVVNNKNDESGPVYYKRVSGMYLISDIEHKISSNSYKQELNLVKPGVTLDE